MSSKSTKTSAVALVPASIIRERYALGSGSPPVMPAAEAARFVPTVAELDELDEVVVQVVVMVVVVVVVVVGSLFSASATAIADGWSALMTKQQQRERQRANERGDEEEGRNAIAHIELTRYRNTRDSEPVIAVVVCCLAPRRSSLQCAVTHTRSVSWLSWW